MTDPFVEQLASLCREHVTRAKWVFVPTHAIGPTIGERLALDGTNWLNLRFVTPLDVALRMGAPFLVERGVEPSEEGLGPALIMRLLLELPKEGGYFRPLADQPTMAQALYATIRELRMAGIKSRDVRAEAFESPAKHAELRALLASYEQHLSNNGRGDMAMVYEEAMRHLDWCPIQPEDCWTEVPDVVWTPLQRRVLDAMPGEWIKPRALAIPGVEVPRRIDRPGGFKTSLADPDRDEPHPLLASKGTVTGGLESASRVDRVEPEHEINPLAFLLRPSAERRTRRAGCVSLFHAGGREAEIEEVFRRILACGAPLDQVEVACSSDEHAALAWEKALRHEWPVTLGPGIPANATRPGRALLGFCDWIETDFSAGHLRRLLHSGDMGLEKDDEGFSAGQAVRILAKSEAGWGRETYRLSLAALRRNYEERANDAEGSDDERAYATEQAGVTRLVLTWIEKLIGSIPVPGADKLVAVQRVVDAALAYLERSTARHNALDHRSAGALAEYVAELRALGSFSCPLPHALRFIRERVQSLQVAPDRPRPGHLYICRLAQAGYSGRPHLFVAGLEEGRVFPSASEDPVLLDAERAAISPSLRLSSDRLDESVYGVLSRLATLGVGRREVGVDRALAPAPATTFSYSCRDLREYRETYASWLMLQAYRLQQGDAALSYTHMKAALGEPVSCVPRSREAAGSLGPWWLRSVVGTGPPGAAVVSRTFPGVARGAEAVAARARPTVSPSSTATSPRRARFWTRADPGTPTRSRRSRRPRGVRSASSSSAAWA